MDPPGDFKVPKSLPTKETAAPKESPVPAPTPGQPTSSYVEPSWSCRPDDEFSFEILKNGLIIETIGDLQNKPFWSFGRLPLVNNIELAHPTISRFHAVLQYRGGEPDDDVNKSNCKPGPGWYIYDLGSTHGTFVNKQRVPSKTYVRLRVGYMLKMGASTRNFILLGPDHDAEEVKAESITEMKEQKQKAIEEMLLKQEQQRLEEEERTRATEAEGVSWGMSEDAEDEPDLSVNPFAVSTNEELFLDDPKKTLRGFFEREGLDLEYKTEDLPNQTFLCKVELPLDDESGRPIVAQVTHKGKKKDCVAQCALEACRILDRHGVLRKANQEAAVRRKKADSDSDNDDDFLDRTGDIEKRRKRKVQAQENSALTFEELTKQEIELRERISALEEKITMSKLVNKRAEVGDTDDLDDYMNQLDKADQKVDKVEIKKYRLEQQAMQKDLKQVQRLIEITRPFEMSKVVGEESSTQSAVGKDKLPLFGKKMKLEVRASVALPSKTGEEEDTEEESMDQEERDIEVKVEGEREENKVVISPPKPLPVPRADRPEKTDIMPPPVAPERVQREEEDQSEAQAKKKARPRVRIRKQVRDNVDMEETQEEVEEKFTDWLPPADQSGDGTTSLNDKLGY